MRRRDFIVGLGAAAWPFVAQGQQPDGMRRIGALWNVPVENSEAVPRVTAFVQGLQEWGWIVGRNVRIEHRWNANNADRIRQAAIELVAFKPDVILATSGIVVAPLQQVTRTIPIVFVAAIDPVGAGLVASLGHPGGNTTGFASRDFSFATKSLELLKQIAPGLRRVAVLRDPTVPAGSAPYGAIQAAAPSLQVEVFPIDTRDPSGVERAVTAFAQIPDGGLILVAYSFAPHRDQIIALAARHHLPTIYPARLFVDEGGLISYAPDLTDQYRRAAGYVDRILNGVKPADLPVQVPTKYELVINRKTATALGLTVPPTLLAIADEVIE